MVSAEQKDTVHVEDGSRSDSHDGASPVDGSVPAIHNKSVINNAAENVKFEHTITIRQAIRYYKWAIFWCLAVRYVTVTLPPSSAK